MALDPIPSLLGGLVASNFRHLDLVAVGVAIAAIATLGFVVFFSDQKSSTNKAFLWFAIATIIYSTANYLSYQVNPTWQILWLLRLTIFTAVWHAFSFFSLFYVFPRTQVRLPGWYLFVLTPLVMVVSILTLTPLIFKDVDHISTSGVATAMLGPAIPIFGLTVVLLVIGGLVELLTKAIRGSELEKKQARVVLVGAIMTFTLILTFNFFLPVFLDVPTYIPLAPVFFLPFIVFTAHAIRKYKFLNIKIIATELFTFALAVVTLIELLFAQNLQALLLRLGMFSLVLGFGILLIRSVMQEVKQREQLRELSANLQVANSRLVELDRLKSQFLSFASHQIKAPLTSIKWQSQLIVDGSMGQVPKEARDAAQSIANATDRLIGLVTEFLDLRKIEEGRMDYQFQTLDVVELVQTVVHDLVPLAQHRELSLTFEESVEHRMASVDPRKFSQVVQNLVDNAIKYTDKGGVQVLVRNETPETITVTVIDTGHGMNPDIIPQLFEEFMRDNATKRIEGTGLGLYIAKQIVGAHRGTIAATSPGQGKGSTFTITIPTAESPSSPSTE